MTQLIQGKTYCLSDQYYFNVFFLKIYILGLTIPINFLPRTRFIYNYTIKQTICMFICAFMMNKLERELSFSGVQNHIIKIMNIRP